MQHTDGEQDVWYDQMRLSKIVKLSVEPNNSRYVVGCFNADVARAYVGVDELDFKQRSEEVNNYGPVEHTKY